MMKSLRISAVAAIACATCTMGRSTFAQGPVVVFDVEPVTRVTGGLVEVGPGETVPFQVTAEVIPTDPVVPDTIGLAAFDTNVITDLGVSQQPVLSFDPAVQPVFPDGVAPGTPVGDDILGVSAAQGVATVTPGLAMSGPQPLVEGELVTPETMGTFRVTVEGTADVFGATSPLTRQPAQVRSGEGFTLRVTEDSEDGLGDDDGDFDGVRNPPDSTTEVDADVDCGAVPPVLLGLMMGSMGVLRLLVSGGAGVGRFGH